MIIKGNTVGTPMPRTDFNQENPAKADYLKGREDLLQLIATAKAAGDKAKEAADNAQTAADDAQTSANNAQAAADDAQTTADNALTAAGDAQTAAVNESKEYTDSKHSTFTATLTINDWEGDAAPYTQTIVIRDAEKPEKGILETDKPHISPVYDKDQETRLAQREAWMMVCDAETGDGEIVFTCFEDKPATAVPIQIEVNR